MQDCDDHEGDLGEEEEDNDNDEHDGGALRVTELPVLSQVPPTES